MKKTPMSLGLPLSTMYFRSVPSLTKPAFSSTRCDAGFSTSATASRRSSHGHAANTASAAARTARVATPRPQCARATRYPTDALNMRPPSSAGAGFTEMDPTTTPPAQMARYHGCGRTWTSRRA